MEMEKTLYDRVYIAGLQSKIQEIISAERGNEVSRNTIHLALRSHPSTPLRKRIREIAEWLLDEQVIAATA